MYRSFRLIPSLSLTHIPAIPLASLHEIRSHALDDLGAVLQIRAVVNELRQVEVYDIKPVDALAVAMEENVAPPDVMMHDAHAM